MNIHRHFARLTSRAFAYIKLAYHRLMQIRDTPHAIAGGVAIGMFFSFTPLIGLRIILALLFAWLSRCSKAAALIAVNLHEVVFYLWWSVWVFEFKIGYRLFYHAGRASESRMLHQLKDLRKLLRVPEMDRLTDFWNSMKPLWPVFEATLIGSVIVGLPIAVLSYFLTLKIVARYQKKIEAGMHSH